MDYVVSSYTPTVTALTERIKVSRENPIDDSVSGLFLTSQPRAPNVPPIAGTTTEVRSIYAMTEEAGIRALSLEGDGTGAKECLEHMQRFSSVHLACHGSQNPTQPLQSRFVFHRGVLELESILKSNLRNADLAFLSACQTSAGEESLADEAVHLSAGMLAAGYRRVVGTMWSIGDAAAQEIAVGFYEYLFSHSTAGTKDGHSFDGTLSAYALHHAIEKYRARAEEADDSLLYWIPFVHLGY